MQCFENFFFRICAQNESKRFKNTDFRTFWGIELLVFYDLLNPGRSIEISFVFILSTIDTVLMCFHTYVLHKLNTS